MMRLVPIVVMAALTAGCATTPINRVPVRIPYYTPAEQDQMAEVLKDPKTPDIVHRWIDDYGDVRAQIRAVNAR